MVEAEEPKGRLIGQRSEVTSKVSWGLTILRMQLLSWMSWYPLEILSGELTWYDLHFNSFTLAAELRVRSRERNKDGNWMTYWKVNVRWWHIGPGVAVIFKLYFLVLSVLAFLCATHPVCDVPEPRQASPTRVEMYIWRTSQPTCLTLFPTPL